MIWRLKVDTDVLEPALIMKCTHILLRKDFAMWHVGSSTYMHRYTTVLVHVLSSIYLVV